MKNVRLYYVVLLLLVICGCKKKGQDGYACLEILSPEFLNFNVVDKTTNSDLFFAAQPGYDVSQLKIYYRKTPISFAVKTDAAKGKYFNAQIPIAYKSTDTLYLEIAGSTPLRPLAYTSQQVSNPCPRYPVDVVKFDGFTYSNVKEQIITLKW